MRKLQKKIAALTASIGMLFGVESALDENTKNL
jgi:hypothetical protein